MSDQPSISYLACRARFAIGEGRRLCELAVDTASEVQRVGRPIGVEVGIVGAL